MPLFLGLHGTFLSDIRHDHCPSAFWRGGKCWHCNPGLLSPEESATRGHTVQRPGWDQPRWEFTVSERAVRQTSATHLRSSNAVSAAHHPRARSQARDSGWSGATACLNRFRGFYESILNWEKIYCNALMNRYFYPPLVIRKPKKPYLFNFLYCYYRSTSTITKLYSPLLILAESTGSCWLVIVNTFFDSEMPLF